MSRTAKSIAEVVTSGLCIGCGLCEAVTKGRVKMEMTSYGGLRPAPADIFTPEEETQLLAACPGVIAKPRAEPDMETDDVWGAHSTMRYAWAGDPDLRFRAATGGVLSALGAHLLSSKKVNFVLHVMADADRPMRSHWVISDTPEQASIRAGSRYGPVAPLAGFIEALDRGEPFAIIAKPCDIGAVHAFAQTDARVDELCIMRMVMVCGGQSRLGKSQGLLKELGLAEEELSLFRYRGYGNPGLTTVETKDGRSFTKTYQEQWEDEGTWELETRCKLCPDALGEAADIAAADVWPGGGPTGEDEGFNGIIVRSSAGENLVKSAVEAGDLVLGEPITPRQFDDLQPHQVRKKEALSARFEGMTEAGLPIIDTPGLRLDQLGSRLDDDARTNQIEGTKRRIKEGRVSEPLPETKG